MLPFSLLTLAQNSASLSGQFSVSDSPTLTLWDNGSTSWIDALADIAPQAPPRIWPNLTTIKRRRSAWDGDTPTAWDGGTTEWIEAATGETTPATPTRWIFGPAIARRGTRWDEPPQTLWDNGKTRYSDVAPGWDTPPGTDERTWVIGPAGPFGCNLFSATGARLTARVWITPPDPQTDAQLSRRSRTREAVAAWKADKSTCTATARNMQSGSYISDYHRWLSYYLKTH
jgi:hypothetical protein